MKVALSLAKHINWRTKKLERKAYVRIAEELNTFGVSPYYVGTIWRKHKQDIVDTVNRDLVKSRDIAVAVAVRHCRRRHRPCPPSRRGRRSFSPLILFDCYVKKLRPRSRHIPMKPH